jgi:hypothetical protein
VTRKRGNLTVLTQCLTLAMARMAVATLASSAAAVTTKSDRGFSVALTGGVAGGIEDFNRSMEERKCQDI